LEMDGITITLLSGLVVSHCVLYYKIGRLEQRVKDLNGSIAKINYEGISKALVQKQGMLGGNIDDVIRDLQGAVNRRVRKRRR